MKNLFGNLIRNSDFMKLWSGETVSRFGTQVTVFSIPMLAALTLNATPTQMGYLGAAMFLPHLLTPLFAGGVVDHQRRRPIMILTNFLRAGLIGSIPLMAFFGEVCMEYLYVVCFFYGVAQVFFELAYHSYLPTLLDRTDLVEANGKIQTSISFAEASGPALAGFLVEWITAPFALIVDALSFLVSAFTTAIIRTPEPQPQSANKGRMVDNIREGFGMVIGIPHLRALAGESATFNLFGIIFQTAFTLFATRQLGLTPAILGLIYMVGSVGSLAGALFSDYATKRLNIGKAMIVSFHLACVPYGFLLALGDSKPLNIAILASAFFISGIGISSSQIFIWSIRQAVTPQGKLGRMNAAYRFFVTGVTPLASLLGGFLGEALGLNVTVMIGALGCLLILPWVYFSPLPAMTKLPDPAALGEGVSPAIPVSAD